MPVPFKRFSAGQVGELSFDILNDVFARIESLEQSVKPDKPRNPRELDFDDLVFARLGVRNQDGRYAWDEAEPLPTNVSNQLVSFGLKSGGANDPYEVPAISLTGQVFAQGDLVALAPIRRSDGLACMGILGLTGGGATRAMILTGTGVSFGNGFWSYTAREANIQFTAQNVWTATPTGPEYVILNLAEFRTDTDGRIGMGTIPPNGVTSVRQPIRAGTVVIVHSIPGLTLGAFFAPNGYAFTCPSDGEP